MFETFWHVMVLSRPEYEAVKKMNVNGVQPPAVTQAMESGGAVVNSSPAGDFVASRDVVEISSAAKLAAQIQNMPDVRADLVARVKSEIENNVYETEERLDIAIDRMMDDIFD